MGKLSKNQEGFTGVEGVLALVVVILVGVVGFMVYNNHQKYAKQSTTIVPATQKSTSTTANKSASTTPTPSNTAPVTAYTNVDLGIKLSYPRGWTVKNDPITINGSTTPFIKFSAPDYKTDGQGYSGTQFSVGGNSSHNTYALDKINVSSNANYSNVVTGITVGGKDAFSYTRTANETGFKSYIVEVNNSGTDSRLFYYASNTADTSQTYSQTNLPVFKTMLDSVSFQ